MPGRAAPIRMHAVCDPPWSLWLGKRHRINRLPGRLAGRRVLRVGRNYLNSQRDIFFNGDDDIVDDDRRGQRRSC